MSRIHIVPCYCKRNVKLSTRRMPWKLFYFNEKGIFVPYEKGEKPTEGFWFLCYICNGEILLTSSIYLHRDICSIIMHHKATDAVIIPTDKKPMGAGIFSTERKVFDSWDNIWANAETPKAFRQPIIDFFAHGFNIL